MKNRLDNLAKLDRRERERFWAFVRTAQQALREIFPENVPAIDRADLVLAHRTLDKINKDIYARMPYTTEG